MVDAIRASTQKGSRKALLSIARDLTEWANGLDPERRSTIDEMLKDHLGRGLDEGIDDTSRVLRRVLKRGRIANDDEGRIVVSRIDAIHSEPAKEDELQVLNGLLGEYEDRHRG